MKTRRRRLLAIGVAGLLLLAVEVGLTAANSVPVTGASRANTAITANTLKPSPCSALTLVNVQTGNNGTNDADLMTGDAGANNMKARNGTDCLLGGAGNDSLDGGEGNDVCIGGSGTDSFEDCETTA